MPNLNPMYKCNNKDGECPNAVNNTPFQLRQGEELKCPECGKKDIELISKVSKDEQKTGERSSKPLVKILLGIGIIALLAIVIYLFWKPKQGPAYLVLAGSNTIGETLGPALIQGYLESLNATNITIHPKIVNGKEVQDEKQIEATLNGKKIYVEIRAHGSKTGFRDLLNDSTNVGMASEPINDSVNQRFVTKKPNENLRSFTNENIIGHDGIAVIVNANNPLSEITMQQLKQIFIDGRVAEWSSIPESGKTGAINLYRRDDKSGTTGMFKSMVLKGGNFNSSAHKIEKSEELVEKVSGDPNAIGYVSYSFAKDHNGIKILALKAADNIQALLPNPLTIKNENYPLSRRLFLYCLNSDTNSHMKPFLQFACNTDAGQSIVERSGFVNLKPIVPSENDSTVYPQDQLPPGYSDLIRNAKKTSVIFRFKFGSSVLDNLAEGDVKRLFDLYYLPQNRTKKIILIGFADNVGNSAGNLIISEQRAEIVRRRLSQLYIPIQTVRGFGDALPVHDNKDEYQRSLNRRVEVWFAN